MCHSELEEDQDYVLLEKQFERAVKLIKELQAKCMKLEEEKEFFRKSLEDQTKERRGSF